MQCDFVEGTFKLYVLGSVSISLQCSFLPFPALFDSGEASERQTAGDAEQAVGEGRKAQAAQGHCDGEQRQWQWQQQQWRRGGFREAREAGARKRPELPSETIAITALRESSSVCAWCKLIP